MSPRRSEPPTIEYVILGLIRLHPTHGYDLFQTLQQEDGIGLIWQIKPGRLYALLEKLERMGWLEPEVKPGEGFPPRKEYRLSPAGEIAFQEWLHSQVTSPHRMRQEFLARLFFAPHEGAQVTEAIIDRQAAVCSGWLESLQTSKAALETSRTFEHRVLAFRIGQVDSMLRWLRACRDELNGRNE